MEKILLLKLEADLKQPITSVDQLKERVKTLTSALTAMPKSGTKEFNNLASTISKGLNIPLGESINRLNQFSKAATNEVRKGKNELKDFNKNLREILPASNSINAMRVRSRALAKEVDNLDTSTAKFVQKSRELKQVNDQLIQLESNTSRFGRGVGNYQTAFKNFGRNFASAFGVGSGIFAFVKLLKDGAKIIGDFDQATADLAAILQITKEEAKEFTDLAKKLGSTTAFTATEVLQLETSLAKLGFNGEEIILATKSVEDFAIAVGANAADAAALAGAQVRAFGLDASETERVVSAMAVSTTKSALDFNKLQVSLSKVSPVAKSFGFTIEETLGLLGTLANAGFEGSSIGTATRNILLNLADSNGLLAKELGGSVNSIEELVPALIKLRNEGINLNEALELTDKRSVAAFSNFLENAESVNTLTDSLTGVGDQLEVLVETKLDSVQGSLKLARSAWEGFVLSIEDGSGPISNSVQGVIDSFSNLFTLLTQINNGEKSFEDIGEGIISKFGIIGAILEELGIIDSFSTQKEKAEDLAKKVEDLFNVVRDQENTTVELFNRNVNDQGYIDNIKQQLERLGLSAEEAETKLFELFGEIDRGFSKTKTDLSSFAEFSSDVSLSSIDEVKGAIAEQVSIINKADFGSPVFKAAATRLKELKKILGEYEKALKDTSKESEVFAVGSLAQLRKSVSELKKEFDESGPEDFKDKLLELSKAKLNLKEKEEEVKAFIKIFDDNNDNSIEKLVERQVDSLNIIRNNALALAVETEANEEILAENRKQINLTADIAILEKRKQLFAEGSQEITKIELDLVEARKKLNSIDESISLGINIQSSNIDKAKEIALNVAQEISTTTEELKDREVLINLQADAAILENKKKLAKEGSTERLKIENDLIRKQTDIRKQALIVDTNLSGDLENIERERLARIKAAQDVFDSESNYTEQVEKINKESYVKTLKERIEATEANTLERLVLEQKLADAEIQIEQEKINAKKALNMELSSFIFDTFNLIANTLLEIQAENDRAETERIIAEIEARNEREAEAIEDKYRKEVAAAGNNSALISKIEDKKAKSIEKIEAEKEAAIEQERKKSFENQKRRDKAAAIVAGGLAVVRILADVPKADFGVATALLIAAAVSETLSQIAIIDAQTYARGGMYGKKERGGYIDKGRPHSTGGNPILDHMGNKIGEVEKDESFVNKRSTSMFYDLISSINNFNNFGKKFPGARTIDLSQFIGGKFNKPSYKQGGPFKISPDVMKMAQGGVVQQRPTSDGSKVEYLLGVLIQDINLMNDNVVGAISNIQSTSEDLQEIYQMIKDEQAAN